MRETELLCAEQQDRRTVDLILRKASFRSLRESGCWHAGVGTSIPECRQWWTAGEQMGRQVWSAKTVAWNELCLSSGQTLLSRIGAAVPRKLVCNSLTSSLPRKQVIPVCQQSHPLGLVALSSVLLKTKGFQFCAEARTSDQLRNLDFIQFEIHWEKDSSTPKALDANILRLTSFALFPWTPSSFTPASQLVWRELSV